MKSRLFERILRESVMSDAEKICEAFHWPSFVVFSKDVSKNIAEATYESFEGMVVTNTNKTKVFYSKRQDDEQQSVSKGLTTALQNVLKNVKVQRSGKQGNNIIPLLDEQTIKTMIQQIEKYVELSKSMSEWEKKSQRVRAGAGENQNTRTYGADDMIIQLLQDTSGAPA